VNYKKNKKSPFYETLWIAKKPPEISATKFRKNVSVAKLDRQQRQTLN